MQSFVLQNRVHAAPVSQFIIIKWKMNSVLAAGRATYGPNEKDMKSDFKTRISTNAFSKVNTSRSALVKTSQEPMAPVQTPRLHLLGVEQRRRLPVASQGEKPR